MNGTSAGDATWSTMGAMMLDSGAAPSGTLGDDYEGGVTADDTESTKGHPVLVISDGEVFNFERQDIMTTSEHTFTVTNEGYGVATGLDVGGLYGAFGIYESTCGDMLEFGDSCKVGVGFGPQFFGLYEDELEVSFMGGDASGSVSRSVRGLGVGGTTNLLTNGDAEQGGWENVPPIGWLLESGAVWRTSEIWPYEGEQLIFAGVGDGVGMLNVLGQMVEDNNLTSWNGGGGVQFFYQAYQRSAILDNAYTWVRLLFLSEGGEVLGVSSLAPSSNLAWHQGFGYEVAPSGTEQVRFELVCSNENGEFCGGHFDAIELWAEWSG
ncbi:MAG: hypothetical protein AAGF11_00100 [Myxococcota bacterium]